MTPRPQQPREPVRIVWFKRDLRVADHVALADAARLGPVLPLLIIEPRLWREPDMAHRHYAFASDGIAELQDALSQLGQPLIVRVGEAVDVFDTLRQAIPIAGLWSHEETGNGWTFARDKAVGALGARERHSLARAAPDRRRPPSPRT